MKETFLTVDETCDKLSITRNTLHVWEKKFEDFPRACAPNGRKSKRFVEREIDEWMMSKRDMKRLD